MKTLADFKRRLLPGLIVAVDFPGAIIRGNLGDTNVPARTLIRKVHSVSASMVVWESAPGTPGSALEWPKATCLQFPGPDTAVASNEPGGEPYATYRFKLTPEEAHERDMVDFCVWLKNWSPPPGRKGGPIPGDAFMAGLRIGERRTNPNPDLDRLIDTLRKVEVQLSMGICHTDSAMQKVMLQSVRDTLKTVAS